MQTKENESYDFKFTIGFETWLLRKTYNKVCDEECLLDLKYFCKISSLKKNCKRQNFGLQLNVFTKRVQTFEIWYVLYSSESREIGHRQYFFHMHVLKELYIAKEIKQLVNVKVTKRRAFGKHEFTKMGEKQKKIKRADKECTKVFYMWVQISLRQVASGTCSCLQFLKKCGCNTKCG